jgi:hypothetical protein
VARQERPLKMPYYSTRSEEEPTILTTPLEHIIFIHGESIQTCHKKWMKWTKKTQFSPWPRDGPWDEKEIRGIHLVLAFRDSERFKFGKATHQRCLAKWEAQAEKG